MARCQRGQGAVHMVKFIGEATIEIGADAQVVWQEAILLEWLKGWDKVLVLEPPSVGGQFVLVEDRHRVSCRWEEVAQTQRLKWSGSNGLGGELTLTRIDTPQANSTIVDYRAVLVPTHAGDKVA